MILFRPPTSVPEEFQHIPLIAALLMFWLWCSVDTVLYFIALYRIRRGTKRRIDELKRRYPEAE